MNAKDREKFYDENIAPELLRLGNLCQKNGLSFVCGVEYDKDEVGRTATLTNDAGEGIRRANQALQGNYGVGMLAMTVTSATPKTAGKEPYQDCGHGFSVSQMERGECQECATPKPKGEDKP